MQMTIIKLDAKVETTRVGMCCYLSTSNSLEKFLLFLKLLKKVFKKKKKNSKGTVSQL